MVKRFARDYYINPYDRTDPQKSEKAGKKTPPSFVYRAIADDDLLSGVVRIKSGSDSVEGVFLPFVLSGTQIHLGKDHQFFYGNLTLYEKLFAGPPKPLDFMRFSDISFDALKEVCGSPHFEISEREYQRIGNMLIALPSIDLPEKRTRVIQENVTYLEERIGTLLEHGEWKQGYPRSAIEIGIMPRVFSDEAKTRDAYFRNQLKGTQRQWKHAEDTEVKTSLPDNLPP
ncbi:MAG: hypothetical protein ABIH34_06615, partial [Nanoarchaeota archaeon]